MHSKIVATETVTTILLDLIPPEERDPKLTIRLASTVVKLDLQNIASKGVPVHLESSIRARDFLIHSQRELLRRVQHLRQRGAPAELFEAQKELGVVVVALMKAEKYLKPYLPPLPDRPALISQGLSWTEKAKTTELVAIDFDQVLYIAEQLRDLEETIWGMIAANEGPTERRPLWLPWALKRLWRIYLLRYEVETLGIRAAEARHSASGIDPEAQYKTLLEETAAGHGYQYDRTDDQLVPAYECTAPSGDAVCKIFIYPAREHFFRAIDATLSALEPYREQQIGFQIRIPTYSPAGIRTLLTGRSQRTRILVKVDERGVDALLDQLQAELETNRIKPFPNLPDHLQTPGLHPALFVVRPRREGEASSPDASLATLRVGPPPPPTTAQSLKRHFYAAKGAWSELAGKVGIAMTDPEVRAAGKDTPPHDSAGILYRPHDNRLVLVLASGFGPNRMAGDVATYVGETILDLRDEKLPLEELAKRVPPKLLKARIRKSDAPGASFVIASIRENGHWTITHGGLCRAMVLSKKDGGLYILTMDQTELPLSLVERSLSDKPLAVPLRDNDARLYHEAFRNSHDEFSPVGGFFLKPTPRLVGHQRYVPIPYAGKWEPDPRSLLVLLGPGIAQNVPWLDLERILRSEMPPADIAKALRDQAVRQMKVREGGNQQSAAALIFRF